MSYRGPLIFSTGLPDGLYAGEAAAGEVRDGQARVVARIGPGASVVLHAVSRAAVEDPDPDREPLSSGPLQLAVNGPDVDLLWSGRRLATLSLALVVLPGDSAGSGDAARGFVPADAHWTRASDGRVRGRLTAPGYEAEVVLRPYGAGWVDAMARVTATAGAVQPSFVALARRFIWPGAHDGRVRFNGRPLAGASEPPVFERDFVYTRGVDWVSWRGDSLMAAVVNQFTPQPTVRRDSVWAPGNALVVREHALAAGDTLVQLSELSGPNPDRARPRYLGVRPYTGIEPGDTARLEWRLALEPVDAAATAAARDDWANGQLYAFAGYLLSRPIAGGEIADLGVREVAFGTSYFPYSTLPENFDFYRVPGLDRETWWPFSPVMWASWRTYMPRMRTDLHIIRAMGFQLVRLHHLELLQEMPRPEAQAWLDWFAATADSLGLKLLMDSEGPEEWLRWLVGRYGRYLTGFELENEILIPPIAPASPARWTAEYRALKAVDPDLDVWLTGVGNNGQFERLRSLGVPFDRVGLHAYKHGPQWPESHASQALSSAGYAQRLDKPVALTEYNWKELTRLSPEDRLVEWRRIYGSLLAPRAIPQVYEFHFQETLSVNPSIARNGTRHYETIALDRRPKPEARELMSLIRRYAAPGSPLRELSFDIPETPLARGTARAIFTLRSDATGPITVSLRAEAFGGLIPRLVSPTRVRLEPGAVTTGEIELRLPPGARPGTYHYFVRADYEGGTRWGWGVAANEGPPTFDPRPVLSGRVDYPQGAGIVRSIRWNAPVAVAFAADAPVLEMEMAYTLASTLQSATGRPVRLSPVKDVPDSVRARGLLFLVGTPSTIPEVGGSTAPPAGHGLVLVKDVGPAQTVLLTGADPRAVQAAASDFVLRFWKHAKDAAIRVAGMEPGNALGHPVRVTNPNPP